MKSKAQFTDKAFGKLLTSGQQVKITNLITNTAITETVKRFNGVEYEMEGKTSYENLGHSGFAVESENVFYVLINMQPILKVEKV